MVRVHAIRVALALGLLWSVAACTPRVVGEITAVTPVVDVVAPRFTTNLQATRIERFDPPGAGAGLSVTVAASAANPNPFDLTVVRLAYTLKLAGEPVAEGVLEPELVVPRLAEASLAWTVDASLADRPELWRAVVGTYAGEPLPFEVEGELRFLSEVYAFTTGVRPLFGGELRAREKIRAPRLATVPGAHSTAIVRPDAAALRVAVEVTNPGDVGYFVSARGVNLALLVPRDAAEYATEVAVTGELPPPTQAEAAEAVAVGAADLAPLPVPAGATVRTELVFVVNPNRLSPIAQVRLLAVLDGKPTVFVLDGPFVFDVLGIDSFPVARTTPVHGVFGGPPP